MATVGYLGASTASASGEGERLAAFAQRLRELGWIEGRSIVTEYRWAEGRSERFAEFAAEFVRLKVDIIVTYAAPAVFGASDGAQMALVLASPFFALGPDRRVGEDTPRALHVHRQTLGPGGGLKAYGVDFALMYRRAACRI
jgi:hypothetical protein